MTTDHAKLRELAERATSGPWGPNVWIETDGDCWRATGPAHEGNAHDQGSEPGCLDEQAAQRDAAYIAAASPDVVLGLLDEIERLRNTDIGEALLDYDDVAQENERLRTRLSTLQSLCIEALEHAQAAITGKHPDLIAGMCRIAAISKEVGGSK